MSRILTLNIGATKVTVAEYALKGKGALTLSAYGSAPLAGLDLEAEGNAQAVLTPAVHEALKAAGVKAGPVHLALGGQMIFPRFAKLPPVEAGKLDELIRYEVEQNVPFPIDEVVFDSQTLGTTDEGDTAAMIVAAKLDQVRAVTDAVSAAGLEPVIVDAGPMAVCNALRHAYPDLDGCNVVLDIGAKTTSLVLIENEKFYFRAIPVAGNAITREIANAYGCSQPDAEELKQRVGYVGLGGVTEDPDQDADRVSKIIRTVLTRLHAEISRSINFYRSQQGGGAPARIFLTGGCSVLPQIDEFFRTSLQVEVEFLNPFGDIGFGAGISEENLETDAFTLAESAGLALRATDGATLKMNLLPPELVERARNKKRFPFIAAGCVCVLGALGAAAFAQHNLCEAAKASSETLGECAARLRRAESDLKKDMEQADVRLADCDALRQLLLSRTEAVSEIDAVRRALLPGVWIVSWGAPTTEGGAAAKESVPGHAVRVALRGWSDRLRALEAKFQKDNGGKKVTAAELVKNELAQNPMLKGGSVRISSQKDVGNKGCLEEFTLDIVFPPPTPLAGSAEKASGKGKGGKKK